MENLAHPITIQTPSLANGPRQGLRDAGKLRKQHILHQVRTGTSPPAPPQPQHPAHLHRTHACRGLGTQERASSPSAPPKSACQGHRCAPLPAARPRQGSGLQPEAKRGHWGRPPPTCPHLWRAQPPGPQHGQLQPCSDSSAASSFPSQPEEKIGLPRANPRGRLRSPS